MFAAYLEKEYLQSYAVKEKLKSRLYSAFSFDILLLLDKYAEFTKAMSPLCLE